MSPIKYDGDPRDMKLRQFLFPKKFQIPGRDKHEYLHNMARVSTIGAPGAMVFWRVNRENVRKPCVLG